jgi:hypothetical protein
MISLVRYGLQLGAERLLALASLPTCANSRCRLCSRFLAGSEERAAVSLRFSSCWISVGSSRSRMTSAQTI